MQICKFIARPNLCGPRLREAATTLAATQDSASGQCNGKLKINEILIVRKDKKSKKMKLVAKVTEKTKKETFFHVVVFLLLGVLAVSCGNRTLSAQIEFVPADSLLVNIDKYVGK